MRTFLFATLLLLASTAPTVPAVGVCAGPGDEVCLDATPDASASARVLSAQATLACPVGGAFCTLTVDDDLTPLGLRSEDRSSHGCTAHSYHTALQTGRLFSLGTCGNAFCFAAVHADCVATNPRLEGTLVCYDSGSPYSGADHVTWRMGEECKGVRVVDGAVCNAHLTRTAGEGHWYMTCVHASTPTRPCFREAWQTEGSSYVETEDTCVGVETRPETCSGSPGQGIYAVVTLRGEPVAQQRVACART